MICMVFIQRNLLAPCDKSRSAVKHISNMNPTAAVPFSGSGHYINHPFFELKLRKQNQDFNTKSSIPLPFGSIIEKSVDITIFEALLRH
ncbi:hypothetical protein QQP08_022375 [Theobroma cacao]|nr:hypothetical protein QQP08_022375 [Theobroma cacao]